MKSLFHKISISQNQSILVKDTFNTNFHFHDDYELIYFSEGSGDCIIGDRTYKYTNGSLFFLSPNLPHRFSGSPGVEPKSFVIQFKHKEFLSTIKMHPELQSVRLLFEKGKRGILFKGFDYNFSRLLSLNTFDRFIELMKILENISRMDDFEVLSSPAFKPDIKFRDYHRINEVYEYVAKNYKEPISLSDISERMHMTTSTFCRYFKKTTKKSFLTHLNEFRAGKACELLRQTDKSISEICYESGFDSIANFNRQFKKYVGDNPRTYRGKYE